MKQSNEDKIEIIKGQMKACSKVSAIAAVITALLLLTEFLAAQFMKGSDYAGTVIKICTYLCYVMPFVIVVPMFVRTNLNVKLHNLRWQEEQKGKADGNKDDDSLDV